MKKHLSVFGFFARSSFFKVLLILLAMCAVEFTFFHFELKNALEAYEVVGACMPSLERMFMRAATNVYFRVALALITVVICLPGCEFKSNTSYTLRRLSISERATFFHQAAYCYLIDSCDFTNASKPSRAYLSTPYWRIRFNNPKSLHALLNLN